jgi:hypothetical protein
MPKYAPLKRAILSVALCQGGAQHWLDGRNGVKDLDVWTLFSADAGISFHAKRLKQIENVDLPGLGKWTRRVDLMGRTVAAPIGTDPATAWRTYLTAPAVPNSSPWFLRQKAVVLLEPAGRRGEVVWPKTA